MFIDQRHTGQQSPWTATPSAQGKQKRRCQHGISACPSKITVCIQKHLWCLSYRCLPLLHINRTFACMQRFWGIPRTRAFVHGTHCLFVDFHLPAPEFSCPVFSAPCPFVLITVVCPSSHRPTALLSSCTSTHICVVTCRRVVTRARGPHPRTTVAAASAMMDVVM